MLRKSTGKTDNDPIGVRVRLEIRGVFLRRPGSFAFDNFSRQLDHLFEIAPLDSLRAELYVPEDEISEVRIEQEGRLATASFSDQRLRFIVERINPADEVVNNRNVFKVRVRLLETRPWIRPGMEGVAKITIEKRRYAWIWSRKAVNWIRMKLTM